MKASFVINLIEALRSGKYVEVSGDSTHKPQESGSPTDVRGVILDLYCSYVDHKENPLDEQPSSVVERRKRLIARMDTSDLIYWAGTTTAKMEAFVMWTTEVFEVSRSFKVVADRVEGYFAGLLKAVADRKRLEDQQKAILHWPQRANAPARPPIVIRTEYQNFLKMAVKPKVAVRCMLCGGKAGVATGEIVHYAGCLRRIRAKDDGPAYEGGTE